MRQVLFVMLMGGVVWGQSMVESAAAAAGGSVGGVAGKKVSDGLNRIFNKVDQHTAKAAEDANKKKAVPEPNAPVIQLTAGSMKVETVGVPPPPPPAHRAAARPKPAPVHVVPPMLAPIPPPPPPDVTAEELKVVTKGMRRDDVLKLGVPSERITMYEEGHLTEIYRYASNQSLVGSVHLTDGKVSEILIR
ncbi:MAG TPA: hypothetical protein VKR43_10110 [Bryobacteraceae bacterium]|jgi:hypothetical protein|nr:hypothetical protein [Bryobacteraceae bacterium]